MTEGEKACKCSVFLVNCYEIININAIKRDEKRSKSRKSEKKFRLDASKEGSRKGKQARICERRRFVMNVIHQQR